LLEHPSKDSLWRTSWVFGYLDLCLFADSKPLVVVENKIDAGFTEHSTISGSEMITIPQLELYDQWLYLENPHAALVLLTQFTEPPEGFLDDVSEHTGLYGNFKISIRRKCLWTAIYTWLAEWAQAVQNHLNERIIFLRILVLEFLHFLEEQKMAPVSLSNSDLQVLKSFFEHEVWRKMQQLLESTRKIVLPKLENPHRLPRALPESHLGHEFDILWDFAYCFEESLMWYIGWGIAGNNGFKALEIPLSEPFPQIFVIATSEKSDIPLRTEDIKYAEESGWTIYDQTQKQKWPRVMKRINAISLNNTGDRFSTEYQQWVMNAAAEANEILKRGHKNR
jgi:hypothetical protein